MTIETRMSYPEGGTECPPDETPLPSSSSATSTNDAKTEKSSNLASNCNSQNPGNESNKIVGADDMDPQRCKLRSQKTAPVLPENKTDQSSEETENANNAEINKTDKCTNCATIMEIGKLQDLKKSIKAKLLGGDGSKEEAASRKSMRLRLRRGKTDNLEDIYGPKERPRYVEDLTSIDFENDKLKIMFMDALGMCPRFEQTMTAKSSSSSSRSFSQGNGTVLENTSGKKIECMECGSAVDAPSGIAAEAKIVMKPELEYTNDRIKFNIDTGGPPGIDIETKTKVLKLPADTSITQLRCSNNDDDSGWESWLTRLSSYKTKSVNASPTKKEINESLIRLVRLGTEVKVIASSPS